MLGLYACFGAAGPNLGADVNSFIYFYEELVKGRIDRDDFIWERIDLAPCTAMAENAEDREHVLQTLNFQSFRRVLFGLLKLGNLCNAIKSKSFIDADSDYECIMYGDFPLAINFSLIFEPGILFLKDVIGRRMEGKMDSEKRALQKLEDYVKEMGKYYIYCFLKSVILAYIYSCNIV